jgi:PilZ domain
MPHEKRQALRAPYLCEGQCDGQGGLGLVSSRLSDLSATGAFVDSLNELPIGTHLTLRSSAARGDGRPRLPMRLATSSPRY